MKLRKLFIGFVMLSVNILTASAITETSVEAATVTGYTIAYYRDECDNFYNGSAGLNVNKPSKAQFYFAGTDIPFEYVISGCTVSDGNCSVTVSWTESKFDSNGNVIGTQSKSVTKSGGWTTGKCAGCGLGQGDSHECPEPKDGVKHTFGKCQDNGCHEGNNAFEAGHYFGDTIQTKSNGKSTPDSYKNDAEYGGHYRTFTVSPSSYTTVNMSASASVTSYHYGDGAHQQVGAAIWTIYDSSMPVNNAYYIKFKNVCNYCKQRGITHYISETEELLKNTNKYLVYA